MSAHGFRYVPLGSQPGWFRLLTLLPGSSDTSLHCQLSNSNLTTRPVYDALSYVWGKPSSPNDSSNVLVLDGHHFLATANLVSALRHLRPPVGAKPITLWVDAVCINQEDLNERGQQVSMMRDIYASAERVVIWIGEEGDGSDAVFDALPVIAGPDEQQGTESRDTKRLNLMRECSSFFISVVDRRPWFSRTWILQELAMAKQDPLVVCGWKSAPWSLFIKGWVAIARDAFEELAIIREQDTKRQRGASNSSATDGNFEMVSLTKLDVLNELREEAMRTQGGESLRKLLMISRSSEATDPRDRIYGLLGMLKVDGSGTTIPVDYHKPTTTVYSDAMAHIFSQGEGPHFLSGVWLPGVSAGAPRIDSLPSTVDQPNLPSWVPDFSRQIAGKATQTSGIHFHPPAGIGASGTGAGCNNGKRLDDGRTLQVEGLFVDTIDQLISLGISLDSCIEKLPALEAVSSEARKQTCQLDPTIAPFIDQFKTKEPLWRILISNKRLRSGYDAAPSSYEDMYLSLLNRNTNKADLDNNNQQNEYELCLNQGIGKRSLFVSKSGFVGTCVAESCVGDTIAILFGSPVPFVLRPIAQTGLETGRKLYALVGGSYVGGIMGGEMVDELYCEDLMDSTTFLIQ
ncbi:HET domain-containing protein [Fusarium sp. LHS14.1]|nr:HET domain-containing protein [Fusarium sp. LHS14.1]